MRPSNTAVNEAAAKRALEDLRRDFGKNSPGLVTASERSCDQFIPFRNSTPPSGGHLHGQRHRVS